jgi:hypothetical protein
MPAVKNMEMIREEVLARIENLCKALMHLSAANESIVGAISEVESAWEGWPTTYGEARKTTEAASIIVNMIHRNIFDDIEAAVQQAGKLIARDVIAPVAREGGPVVWLTSNSYMPPIRDLPEVERVWNADDTGEFFPLLIESIERTLDEEKVLMEAPEYDNALYVVDLTRWEYIDEDELPEDIFEKGLDAEWRPIVREA